jgi:hypothetical protein
MASKQRFHPPPFEITPEIRWVLRRAFAEAPTENVSLSAPALAVRQARLLGLSCRIAHRNPAEVLEAELSSEVASDLKSDLQRAVASSLVHQKLYEIVIETAQKAGVTFAVLKGMALVASGVTAPGSRPFGDLDILVSEEDAEELSATFHQRDFKAAPIDDSAQHLPALWHPKYGVLEVHTFIPGISVEGSREARRGASLESLQAAGLCRAVPYHSQILMPDRGTLAAHSIVHALHQHGLSPVGYPFFRMPADVLDLSKGASGVDALLLKVSSLVEDSVTMTELVAVGELCEELAREEAPQSKKTTILLHHGLAGALDADYGAALKASALFRAIGRGDWSKLSERLRLTLRPNYSSHGELEYAGQTAGLIESRSKQGRLQRCWRGVLVIIRSGLAWLRHFVRTRVKGNR